MSAFPLPVRTLRSELQTILDNLGRLPIDEAPALLGELEQVKAAVWLKMTSSAPAAAQHDELLDASVAAPRLNFSKDYLYRNAAKFPFTCREGRSLRFSARGIDEYIRAKCNKDSLTAKQHKRKLALA